MAMTMAMTMAMAMPVQTCDNPPQAQPTPYPLVTYYNDMPEPSSQSPNLRL
jgi:hypothetical protein